MISSSTQLQNILKQNSSIESRVGCEIEYNMNSLIEGVTVVSTATNEDYKSGISPTDQGEVWSNTKPNPFKKLFPIDSILKPFRPAYPGAKYFIMSGPTVKDTLEGGFLPFRTLRYTGEGKDFNVAGAKPRLYYPGITTEYKYWLSPLNKNIDLTVQYLHTQESYAAAGGKGTRPVGNKAALANKIYIKFEKFHSIPTNYKITITKSDNTTMVVGPTNTTSTESGLILLTLENGAWTKRSGETPVPAATVLSDPILIKSIRLEATNPGGGKYLGVIEISARWSMNISEDLTGLDINKESTASSEDILPVGLVTANTASFQLNRFNEQALKIKTYLREQTSFETDVIYMTKNAEIRPYFDVACPSGTINIGGTIFERLNQGTFYLDSWDINQYGETSATALDGAKYLMEILSPDLLCENSPVVAILRNLLDSVGFTNYKFNMTEDDRSIPEINYWWTQDTNTVWDEIQSLCRDIQMNAFFDENNILQFYSRDYTYAQSTALHNFYESQQLTNMPNIISFSKKEIASANSVQVKWSSPLASNYLGSAGPLWTSPVSFLSAGALKEEIDSSSEEIVMDQISLDPYGEQQSFYNYAGFVLVDSEIIEFDAIGYDYLPLNEANKTARVSVWARSAADVTSYLSLSKPGFEDSKKPESAYFKPSGKLRIKKDENGVIVGRGALGSKSEDHKISKERLDANWQGRVLAFNSREQVLRSSDGNFPSYNFTTFIQITGQPTSTTLRLDGATSAPGLKVTVQELSEQNTNVGSAIVENYIAKKNNKVDIKIGSSLLDDVTVSLIPGTKYKITVQPKNSSNTSRGDSQTIVYRVVKNQFNGALENHPTRPTGISDTGTSFFKLSASNLNPGQVALAYRSFSSIEVPSSPSTSSAYLTNLFGDYFQSTVEDHHYAFGTKVFLDKSSVNPKQAAGLAFFVNDSGNSGYFVIIEALVSSAARNTKSVRIVKTTPLGTKVIKDSQVTLRSTVDAIYPGLSYAIEVKARVSGEKVFIDAYINGTLIQAVDNNYITVEDGIVEDVNWIIFPTNNAGIVCQFGTAMFDYVYGSRISLEDYKNTGIKNLYQGQFSSNMINTAFGEVMYNSNNDPVEAEGLKESIDEFGSVVREIAYIKQKFDSRPLFPIYWSTGANNLATIIGSKMSSFGAEAYILNNASTRIPLSDGGLNTLSINGNNLSESGEVIYSTDETSEYSFKEPIIFDSTWIQNQEDARQLAEWIKEKVVNKSRVVTMSIFGNPLISVGDIVSILNTYQGFDGTEKLIVTRVEHSFNNGLETSITCRTI